MRTLPASLGVACFALAAGLALPTVALAGECTSGQCGTPQQSGGGCGCGCGSILVAMTDRGDTYQFADDQDGDGIEDEYDNCAFRSNFDQLDGDGDGVGDVCDICVSDPNPVQRDLNGNGIGDECDPDRDGDGLLNEVDNCPSVPNLSQLDSDTNGIGDVCDSEWLDRCRLDPAGENCNDDPDGDGIGLGVDNCEGINNPLDSLTGLQPDVDGDGKGDACDDDIDGDGIINWKDNCAFVANPSQFDFDNDGLGDAGMFGEGAESCDDRECYVVNRDAAGDCLDPNVAFRVQLALAGAAVDGIFGVGDPIEVRVFTNRIDVLHNWTARFEELPKDSDVSLVNGVGASATMNGVNGEKTPQLGACLQYGDDGRCSESNTIRFTPDAPGRYVIKVTSKLPQGDAIGPDTATMSIVAEVEGEPQGGCASAGASGGLAALALGLLALGGLRRRR